MARRLGVEKVVLKQGSMFLHFVDDSNKAYYQSAAFGRILSWLQANVARCQIRDRQGKRSFVISHVPTAEAATAIFAAIMKLDPAPAA